MMAAMQARRCVSAMAAAAAWPGTLATVPLAVEVERAGAAHIGTCTTLLLHAHTEQTFRKRRAPLCSLCRSLPRPSQACAERHGC
jgi:hypothetical protein